MPRSDRHRGESPDLVGRIAELERRLKTLETQPRANNTSVDKGAVRIIHPDGNPVAILGKEDIDGTDYWGVTIRDPDGSLAGVFGSDDSGNSRLEFYDQEGNPVFSVNDTDFGIVRPIIPAFVDRESEYIAPPVTTTSTSFVALWRISCHIQAVKMRIGVRVLNDAGCSSEVRVWSLATSEVVAGPTAVGVAANTTITFEWDVTGTVVPGAYEDFTQFLVEVRRTAGAASIRTLIYFVINYGGGL